MNTRILRQKRSINKGLRNITQLYDIVHVSDQGDKLNYLN